MQTYLIFCHCEEPAIVSVADDEAISKKGLLRFARNDNYCVFISYIRQN